MFGTRHVVSTILLVAACTLIAKGNDWPRWRGPTSNGKSPLKDIKKTWPGGLEKQWETAELIAGDTSKNITCAGPVSSKGILVVPGRTEKKDLIFGFNADTGERVWKQAYDAVPRKPTKWSGPRATPCIDGKSVFTFGALGHLACWDLKTGKQKWMRNVLQDSKTKVPYWGCCSSPVVYGDNVLVEYGGYSQGPNAALVMAYNKKTGDPAWKSPNSHGSWGGLTIVKLDGKDQLLAWASKSLKGLSPVDGTFYWSIPWKTAYSCHATTPIVDGSILFMTSGYKTGCQAFKIKGDKPTPLWEKSKVIASCNSDPIHEKGHIYCFSGTGDRGDLKCLELKTGKVVWETKELGNGSLVYADGHLICLTYAGKMALVEAKSGKYRKLGEFQAFEKKPKLPVYTAPIIAGTRIYVRYQERLICYDLKK